MHGKSRTSWPGLDHPSFIPAALMPDPDADLPANRPRTTRDWLVDATAFVVAVALGIAFFEAANIELDQTPTLGHRMIDYGFGALAWIALWWRRRWPVGVALVLLVPAMFSVSSSAALVVAVFTVAVHRPFRVSIPVVGLHLVAAAIFAAIHDSLDPFEIEMAWSFGIYAVAVAWASFVRARRQLVISLQERAQRAESEQRLQAEQARLAERARIAREMHDVLGHRVSLIALQAGGLEMQPDRPPSEVRASAEVIRGTARQALEELRNVIGVLRQEDADDAPPAPQPTLNDIRRLVEESRRAGAHVELEISVDKAQAAPAALGRDTYRIVQEALTNVHKHVRGAATTVEIVGAPGSDLRVTVSNRIPGQLPAVPPLPGSGSGLVGLTERVSLSGGSLRHGSTADGQFVVDAVLRWPQER